MTHTMWEWASGRVRSGDWLWMDPASWEPCHVLQGVGDGGLGVARCVP